MNAFSSPADRTAALPAASTMAAPQCETSSPLLLPDVGQERLSHSARIAEDRLDAEIRRLGLQSAAAMKQGDPTGARLYADQMTAAIRSRSPAHQARLKDENEQRMNAGADFFQWQGRLAAELAAKAGAAKP